MESSGPFVDTNKRIARYYWYSVAGCIALFALLRVIRTFRAYCGAYRHQRDPTIIPSRPQRGNIISSIYATLTATIREIAYPQPLHFDGHFAKHFTPPPLGRILVVLIYWASILVALWKDAILTPESPLYAYYWEKIAFRAAWVSVTQLPLIYCLSCKHNVISWITGISYERLNWMHRWTAVTLFFTVIVHWSFFYREWVLGNIVAMEFSMMTMVKYGFGAWAVIGWMVLTSFGFFRELAYEFWVTQHVLASLILLWLVHAHVPSYATHNVWMAVAFVVMDRGLRFFMLAWRNTKSWKLGYEASLELLPGRAVQMTIKNIPFKWKAGQHVYVCVPSIGIFENHPFTICNDCSDRRSLSLNDIRLVIKACTGFSNRLHNKCSTIQGIASSVRVKAFVSGPWGMPPKLTPFDSVVLIASGTGAAFTTPLLERLASFPGFVRRIELNWIIPSRAELEWFEAQLTPILRSNEYGSTAFQLNIFVSNSDGTVRNDIREVSEAEKMSSVDSASIVATDSGPFEPLFRTRERQPTPTQMQSSTRLLFFQRNANVTFGKRPTPEEMIRPALERAKGETAVVVCGSSGLVASVRNYVSYISDERAVHKGTGAQGIYLFTERFDW